MSETVEIPVEWHEHIHPRRGGIPGPPVSLDEGAAERARAWGLAARPIAEEMGEHERTDPELGRALRAWLDGEPDPAGAAAAAAVAVKYLDGVDGPAFLDAWALDHGLAFAACAVTEAFSIEAAPCRHPRRRCPAASSGSSRTSAANGPGDGAARSGAPPTATTSRSASGSPRTRW
ncbi:hypothetical protein ACFQY7_08140 [Actinomadura luteofluorescens]|uniref:hypothetical protein n=1 Tax=Actinomadura luteofluorescens TaxID=46163 RepID=UPI00362C65D7